MTIRVRSRFRDVAPVAVLLAAAMASVPGLAGQEDFCGEPQEVDHFAFSHGGSEYSVSAFVRMTRDGHVVFEDEEPRRLVTRYYRAELAEVGDIGLLIVSYTDCVDILFRRLFVLRPERELLPERVWTSHWTDGFLVEEEGLVYWSEWFCHEANQEITPEASYVYVLSSGGESFERREVGRQQYCGRADQLAFLEFSAVAAVLRQ